MSKELIKKTIEFEGGYVNNPLDAGGETKYGISKRSYPSVDIKNLGIDDATDIYLKDYWKRLNLHLLLSEKICWKVFDIGVNMGLTTGIRFLQKVAKVKEDGVLGPLTADIVNSLPEETILNQLIEYQLLRYVEIVEKKNSQIVFLKGWVRRALQR